MEVAPERAPQRLERADAEQVAGPRQPDPPRQPERRRRRRGQEGRPQRVVGPPRLGHEAAKAQRLGRSGEGADRGFRRREVGEQVERFTRPPGVPRQRRHRRQRQMIAQRRPARGEDLVEDPAHGEHRRPGIDRAAGGGDLAQLAARRRRRLAHGDGVAARREQGGGGQAADAGADDDDGFGHRRLLSRKHGRDASVVAARPRLDPCATAPHTAAMASWRERWTRWRNARLADPGFQRWAAGFPLTRPIARARAGRLFDIVAGFVYSQVAAAVVATDLLPFLRAAPRSLGEIAAHTGLPADGAERLVKAATALGLAERLGDRWTLGSDGAALLGNPGVAEMIAHHRFLYADLADPVALLRRRGGSLADYWGYAGDDVAPYSALMAASQPGIAAAVLDAFPVARHRALLDVGGGQGVFAAAALNRASGLAATVFDLPTVVARIADPRLARAGGSFTADPLPAGADLITLVRVVHDHDDAVVAALLAKVHAALPPGGTLLLAEPMAATPGAEPIGDAYFGLYLWAMGSGQPRTATRLAEMLAAAGFTRVREHRTAIPALVRVLSATKVG